MKKFTLLGLAVLLASSFIQATNEADEEEGIFSRACTAYVDANVNIAQWAGEKLNLGIAEAAACGGLMVDGKAAEGFDSSIQSHRYRTTAVVTSAAIALTYGVYKLGQATGINAKIAHVKDALCRPFRSADKKEADEAQAVTPLTNTDSCKKDLSTDPAALAKDQVKLGLQFLSGYVVPQNLALAHAYFQMAANQTASPKARAEAQLYLGRLYLDGNGVQKDLVKAREYLTAAATNAQASFDAILMGSDLLIRLEKEEKALHPQNSALKKKNIIDNLQSLEKVLQENNLKQHLPVVQDTLRSFQTKPYGLNLIKSAAILAIAINGQTEVKYFGQPTTISVFLDPIMETINTEMIRLEKEAANKTKA